MAKRESRGGYRGGSTSVSGRDADWFSRGSTRLKPEEHTARMPPRSPTEQAAYDDFVSRWKAGETLSTEGWGASRKRRRT